MSKTKTHILVRAKDALLQGKSTIVRHKRPVLIAVGAALLVGGATFAVKRGWMPRPVLPITMSSAQPAHTPTLEELENATKKAPHDAAAFLALGDAQFANGKIGPGLRSYDRALQLDGKASSDQMGKNLMNCFGTNEQPAAEAIISTYKVTSAEPGLRLLAANPNHAMRWKAMGLLQKLNGAREVDYVHAWLADLKEPDCDTRRAAMEGLGKHAHKNALEAIHQAQVEDGKTWKFLVGTCLGDRPEEAEKAILARR